MNKKDKELFLKAITSYLTYGVKYLATAGKIGFIPTELTTRNLRTVEHYELKLLLHPLSEFRGYINHNGKEVRVCDIAYNRWLKIMSSPNYEVSHSVDNRMIFDRMVNDFKHIKFLPFWMIDILLEYHFDIYGMIDKDFAENPINLYLQVENNKYGIDRWGIKK